MNWLEQLIAEWLEFQGYFVRRNVLIGPRERGGYDGELDVVGFHPGLKRLVHYEASSDADSWEKRNLRFARKFELGRKHIPQLFAGMNLPATLEQFVVLTIASKVSHAEIGGAPIILINELMHEIHEEMATKRIESSAVREQFVILRTLQYWAHAERRNRSRPTTTRAPSP